MKVLALETSTNVASVAISDVDKILAEITINHRRNHSQTLMTIIEQLMLDLDMQLKEIDYFAISNGPGSFTGIRIGVATIKAFAQALRKPVISVSSLDGLAYNHMSFTGLVCPLIDARNNQVYTSLYFADSRSIKQIHAYSALNISSILDVINEYNEDIIFCGDGAVLHGKMLLDFLGSRAKLSDSVLMYPRASTIAKIAMGKISKNYTFHYNEINPFYLRKSQAEQVRERLTKK